MKVHIITISEHDGRGGETKRNYAAYADKETADRVSGIMKEKTPKTDDGYPIEYDVETFNINGISDNGW